eukprot:Gb_22856 [translate_table: standard]
MLCKLVDIAWARDYAPEENDHMEIEDKSRQPPPYRQTDLNSLLNGDPLLPFSCLWAMDAINLFIDDPLFRAPLSRPNTQTRGWMRTPWDAREDDDAFRLWVDMLGLGKEDVKVQVEDNMLIIKGEGDAEDIKYSTRVELPVDLYKANQVKDGRKNGVRKITVPEIAKEK